MDAAEYQHGVLGLIFLKYISDGFPLLHDAEPIMGEIAHLSAVTSGIL